ncbi:methyl-accepting chemotaxis protein [Pseudomonas sp. RC10]|uniref:methyl-accepting chemotaxis protein n=1 Tax=Pseudomonas bambusae TaxID=3139142 RepID=UPI003138734C
MKLSFPTRTKLTLGFCLLVTAGMLTYQHIQISLLQDRVGQSADQGSLDTVLSKLEQVDEKLMAADGKEPVSDKDFRAAQHALSNRLDAAHDLAKQAMESVEKLRQNAASVEDLMLLKASVENMNAVLIELKSVQLNPVAASPRAARTERTRVKPKPSSPPFEVIGIEYRGGQEFLAVAPSGSTQLSQVDLVRPGDTVMSSAWKLRALEGTSARFDIAGVSHTIALAP